MEMEMEMEEPSSSLHAGRRRCREYLLALEEERRKIQVFQRELPLCLDLVAQTIEGMRSQMDGVGSEETVSDHAPVLEEFIPLKPSLSPSSSEEDSTHAAAPKRDEAEMRPPTPETKKATPDWLQSVQLWSQEPQQPSPNKELPCKPVALNATKTGGAFHPFEKEKRPEQLQASSTTAAAVVGDKAATTSCGTDGTQEIKDVVRSKEKDKEAQSSQASGRKPRRSWAPELHRRFLQALQQLGGSHAATPKQIRELMKVDGLTNDEVKSHLQKYRLHKRRPSSTAHGAAAVASPPPQFVMVGSCIWLPQPEYAADAKGSTNPVYAPVATLPSGMRPNPQKQQQQGQRPSSRCSEGRRSGDTGDASSASPAVSSSSQTTSA